MSILTDEERAELREAGRQIRLIDKIQLNVGSILRRRRIVTKQLYANFEMWYLSKFQGHANVFRAHFFHQLAYKKRRRD